MRNDHAAGNLVSRDGARLDALAATGIDTTGMTFLAAGLGLMGALLLALARRRRVAGGAGGAAPVPVAATTSAGAGTGAGAGTSTAGMTPNGTSAQTSSPAATVWAGGSTATRDSAGDAPDVGVDALRLAGPAEVADVPDMQPVMSGLTPVLPVTVTDSQGATITIKRADRVIALDLYGTLTDTIIGLGLTDRLVGRGVSDTQHAIAALPVVSLGGIDLNIEAVLSLRPDVVLTNMTIGSKPLYRQLESAGVTVVRFDTVPTLAGMGQTIRSVGAVFGLAAQAEQLARSTYQRLDEVRAKIAALRAATSRPPRALVVYVRGSAGIFFIFGADYGAADLLVELGLDDVADARGITGLTPANPESLIDLDPEIVLTMRRGLETAGGVDGLLARPGMSGTVAGRTQRIVVAADSQLLSYGPRTPDNLLAVARTLYTDDDSR